LPPTSLSTLRLTPHKPRLARWWWFDMMNEILAWLGAGWILWCCLHSLLINIPVKEYAIQLFKRVGFSGFRYRAFYTVISCVTLLPLAALTVLLRGEVVFVWRGSWRLLELGLAVAALWLFWAGAKHYDLHHMAVGKEREEAERAEIRFSREGVHGMVRHPWYLGSLFFLWAWPVYHQATALAALILSCYLLIGSFIEERRLVAEFGDNYRQYQREVSMLIPWKWLSKRLLPKRKGHRP